MSFVPPLPFGEKCSPCPVVDAESRLRSLVASAYLDALAREAALRHFAEWVLLNLHPDAEDAHDLGEARRMAQSALGPAPSDLPDWLQALEARLFSLPSPVPQEFRPTSDSSSEGAP